MVREYLSSSSRGGGRGLAALRRVDTRQAFGCTMTAAGDPTCRISSTDATKVNGGK